MRKLVFLIFYLLLLSPFLSMIYTIGLGLPKTVIHFSTYLVAILGSIFLVVRKSIKIPAYLWFLLLYAFYTGFTQFFIVETDDHWLTQLYNSFLTFYATFLIVIVIKNTHVREPFIKNSIKIIKMTFIVAAIVSVIQVFDYRFLNAAIYWDTKDAVLYTIYTVRRSSIFGFENFNSLGLSFMPLVAVFIAHTLIIKDKSYVIFLILAGIIALLSNSRYIIVSYIIILLMVMLVVKTNPLKTAKNAILVICVFFILFYTLQWLGYDIQEWQQTRLLVEGGLEETTRYRAISTFALFFPQNWLFGTGYFLTEEIAEASRVIASSSRIHVGYLSHLVSYGVIGSFLLWSFWFFLARDLYRNAKKTNYWGAFVAFLIFFWAQATLVHFSVFFPGLIIALVYDKYHTDKLLLHNSNLISTNKMNNNL